MDLDKVKRIIKENEEEIRNIDNADTLNIEYSKETLADRREFLVEQTNKLKEFLALFEENQRKIKGLEKTKTGNRENDKKIEKNINELNTNIEKAGKIVKKIERGKARNVVSSYFNQVDKKIHNVIYNKFGNLSNSFWKWHCGLVNRRYANVPKYILKNIVIGLGIVVVPGIIVSLAPALSGIMVYSGLAFGGFMANTLVKAFSANYNKIVYGGPLLQKEYKLLGGSYRENIDTALYQYKKSKLIVNSNTIGTKVTLNTNNEVNKSEVETVTNDNTDENKKNSIIDKLNQEIRNFDLINSTLDDLRLIVAKANGQENRLEEDVKAKYNQILVKYEMLQNKSEIRENVVEDNTEENINNQVSEPVENEERKADKNVNVNDYAKVSFPKMSDNTNLTFSKAISIVRNPKLSYEQKHDAMAKIIMTLGNRKRKPSNTPVEKLNKFNRDEREMAEIGRKIKNNTASDKDLNRLAELIYHFSGQGDAFEDYIDDEYERYLEYKEKNEGRSR